VSFSWENILFENHFCIGSGFFEKVKETKSDIHFFVKSDILWKKWYPIGKKWYPLKKSDVPLGSEMGAVARGKEQSFEKLFSHWFRIFWKSQRKKSDILFFAKSDILWKKWYPIGKKVISFENRWCPIGKIWVSLKKSDVPLEIFWHPLKKSDIPLDEKIFWGNHFFVIVGTNRE
jgi:hypothetical protein